MNDVKVKFTGDGAGFRREADQVLGKLGDIRGELLGGLKTALFATFSIEALKKFRAEFKEFVDDIEIARKQTGASTTDLQVWEKQIKKVGGEMSDLTRIINKLAVARDKAIEDPNSKEAKALANLGFDRTKVINTSAPEMFKQMQEQISKSGSGIGHMGDLMDLLGEKSVKFLRVFNASFDQTEAKMKKIGALVDEELIARFKKLEEIDKQLTLGDALLGGKQGKGEAVSATEDAWVRFKSGLQALTVIPAGIMDMLGNDSDFTNANRIWKQVEDTQVQLAVNGSESSVGNLMRGGAMGSLTPLQYEKLSEDSQTNIANKMAARKRIAELEDGLRKSALTDEQKLTEALQAQYELKKKMDVLEKDPKKQNEFLTAKENYLRSIPALVELQKKVDSTKEKEQTKAEQDKAERDKDVNSYLKKTRGTLFSSPEAGNDGLISTGNFLGNSRGKLETLAAQQAQTMVNIENLLREFLAKNPDKKSSDFSLAGL